MTIQSQVGVKLAYSKETTYGAAANSAAGQLLRRTDSTLALQKTLLEPKELRSDQQKPLARHGQRDVKGDINGELSPGTYRDFFAAVCRRDFTPGVALAGMATIQAIAAQAGPPIVPGQFVRSAGSWITDGIRVGDVVNLGGWTTTATANNGVNYTVIGLTPTTMSVAEPVTAKAAGDNVTVTVVGKKTFIPASGHTNNSYTVEHWYPDAGMSNLYTGVRVSAVDLNFPPNQIATVKVALVGQNEQRATAQYFNSPAVETTTGLLAGLSGKVFINGNQVGLITQLGINIDAGLQTGQVVGANKTPDVFAGTAVAVKGNISLYLDSPTYFGLFDDEVPVSIVCRFDAPNGTDFIAIAIPYATIAGGTISSSNNAMQVAFQFAAGRGPAPGTTGWETTSIQIQDSQA